MNRPNKYLLLKSKFLVTGFVIMVVLFSTNTLFAEGQGPRPEPMTVGVLDGMAFSGILGMDDGDVRDSFVFAKGTFVSTECERRCGYVARPYYVRKDGDKTDFISESICLHKNSKIVWRGTVEGETIKGVATWTVERWYWTIEKEYSFEGTLVGSAGPVASSE